jgi:hypothetical protein
MNWVYDMAIYLEADNHQQDMELMTGQRGSSVVNVIKLFFFVTKVATTISLSVLRYVLGYPF